MYEYLFLRTLSNHLLSVAAIYGRDRDKEWDLQDHNLDDVYCMLCHDAGADAYIGIWRGLHCILRTVLRDCMYSGLSYGTTHFQNTVVETDSAHKENVRNIMENRR